MPPCAVVFALASVLFALSAVALSAVTVEAASAVAGAAAAVSAGGVEVGRGGSSAKASDPTPMHKEIDSTFARIIYKPPLPLLELLGNKVHRLQLRGSPAIAPEFPSPVVSSYVAAKSSLGQSKKGASNKSTPDKLDPAQTVPAPRGCPV